MLALTHAYAHLVGDLWRVRVCCSFCEYPQEIGIQFDEGMVSVAQIQLLSHQYLIATKIELFAGVGDSYETAKFKRLGYACFVCHMARLECRLPLTCDWCVGICPWTATNVATTGHGS